MHNPGLHFATRGRRLPTHARGVPAPPCDRKGAYSAQEAAPLPALNAPPCDFFRKGAPERRAKKPYFLFFTVAFSDLCVYIFTTKDRTH